MVARFSLTCPNCKNDTFKAVQLINDFPQFQQENEWQSQLSFQCQECNSKLAQIDEDHSGKISCSINSQ